MLMVWLMLIQQVAFIFPSRWQGRGWQKDRNGDIWDWYHSGYWTETEQDNDIRHAFVKISMLGAYDYPRPLWRISRFHC